MVDERIAFPNILPSNLKLRLLVSSSRRFYVDVDVIFHRRGTRSDDGKREGSTSRVADVAVVSDSNSP
jgi:hypothetical protein